MKAVAKLKVMGDMQVEVTLQMTVEEMRALVKMLREGPEPWPAWQLREVLQNALAKAEATFIGEHQLRE